MRIDSIVVTAGFGAGVITDMDHDGLVRVAKRQAGRDGKTAARWMREKDIVEVVAF